MLAMQAGPSGGIRTHGLMVPNHARYQLRYTRMVFHGHSVDTRKELAFPVRPAGAGRTGAVRGGMLPLRAASPPQTAGCSRT